MRTVVNGKNVFDGENLPTTHPTENTAAASNFIKIALQVARQESFDVESIKVLESSLRDALKQVRKAHNYVKYCA
jgi:hypothetical protein